MNLTGLSWKKVVNVLKLLVSTTSLIAPISAVIPFHKVIMWELTRNPPSIKEVTEAIANRVQRRIQNGGYKDHDRSVLATTVSPRFKSLTSLPRSRNFPYKDWSSLSEFYVWHCKSEDNDEDESKLCIRFWSEAPTPSVSSVSSNAISVDAKAKAFAVSSFFVLRSHHF